MERRAKANLYDTSARVCVQLVLAPYRRYGLSVAVRWYVLKRRLLELFASQGLLQAVTRVSKKASTGSKGNKDGNKIKLE